MEKNVLLWVGVLGWVLMPQVFADYTGNTVPRTIEIACGRSELVQFIYPAGPTYKNKGSSRGDSFKYTIPYGEAACPNSGGDNSQVEEFGERCAQAYNDRKNLLDSLNEDAQRNCSSWADMLYGRAHCKEEANVAPRCPAISNPCVKNRLEPNLCGTVTPYRMISSQPILRYLPLPNGKCHYSCEMEHTQGGADHGYINIGCGTCAEF
ncbi:MAG: hypothetical protein AB7F66_08415 [Bacteriovoracia bacterium]